MLKNAKKNDAKKTLKKDVKRKFDQTVYLLKISNLIQVVRTDAVLQRTMA